MLLVVIVVVPNHRRRGTNRHHTAHFHRSRDPVLSISLLTLVGAMVGTGLVKRVASVVEHMEGDVLQVSKPMRFRVSVSCWHLVLTCAVSMDTHLHILTPQ